MDTREQLKTLTTTDVVPPFADKVRSAIRQPLAARGVEILQVNVGKLCNLRCKHCHVGAGPERTEVMSRQTMEQCLAIARESSITTIDITGGSPEVNPDMAWFISQAAALGRRLMVRSNLAILLDSSYRHFVDLYAGRGVEVVGSLPDYMEERTDRQRGKQIFHRTIEAMKLLNARGYGKKGTGLVLDLVHNPAGAYLPGPQPALEQEYRSRLEREHGVVFNRLFCLTNCPLGRYLEYLLRTDNYQDYMQALANAFNPAAAENAMCTTTLSVGWDGKLYDCDFNQTLELPVDHGAPSHIDVFDLRKLSAREIMVNNHCYACTAGSGSSCQGATSE